MEDRILNFFSWLTPVFQHPSIAELPLGASEKLIMDELRDGWGKIDTASLLKGLSKKYGELAEKVVGKIISVRIREDWGEIGKSEAHKGTEIKDFINLLWEPLKEQGFIYSCETNGSDATFCVTKCPVYDLAESTGLHGWLYQFACATDLHTACAFSPKIEFKRTKTLMEGCSFCNHSYSYKD
jgi:predicted ArsR family transcriptional regulator